MYPHLVSLNLSIHSIMFRAVPCMILVVLSIMLIYVLGIANKNKRKLVDRQEDRQQTDFNRTTTMLLLIVILFIIMEFPNGNKKFFHIYNVIWSILGFCTNWVKIVVLILQVKTLEIHMYCICHFVA